MSNLSAHDQNRTVFSRVSKPTTHKQQTDRFKKKISSRNILKLFMA